MDGPAARRVKNASGSVVSRGAHESGTQEGRIGSVVTLATAEAARERCRRRCLLGDDIREVLFAWTCGRAGVLRTRSYGTLKSGTDSWPRIQRTSGSSWTAG